MVDIHSHFLFGLDDGARDRESSIAMLRLAFEQGTTDIVATPHSDLKYPFQPSAIQAQLAELRELERVPRLHRGCDFHLSFDNIEDCRKHPEKYSINGKRYLLVEFANMLVPAGIAGVFEQMQRNGLTPIVTHPERNPLLQKRLPEVAEWVESGCRVQVTGQSLLGGFGRTAERIARELMESGMVHFVASDGHDVKHRPTTLLPAFEQVRKDYGEQVAKRLFVTNPAAVLTGTHFDVPAPTKNGRAWFKLW